MYSYMHYNSNTVFITVYFCLHCTDRRPSVFLAARSRIVLREGLSARVECRFIASSSQLRAGRRDRRSIPDIDLGP